MAYRDYIQPKIPSEWRGAERTYALMVQNVFDDLHMPIQESWLSDSLVKKIDGSSGSGSSASADYSETEREVGKWLDGAQIYCQTVIVENMTANLTAGVGISPVGNLLDVKGFVKASNGACYPVNGGSDSVSVLAWKPADGNNQLYVRSSVAGTGYFTFYYTYGEPAPITENSIFFNDGYVEDGGVQIPWGANQLTRPNDSTHGYTSNGYATLDQVSTNGRMVLYNGTGGTVYYYNSHVCTANLIHIPANATKLIVKASRGPQSCQINLALLPNDAPNSMDVSNGGVISTFYTLTTTPTDYSLYLDELMPNSDDYRIVINFRGKSDVYRAAYITKVFFE